jgi:cysteine desulfurase
VSLIYFDNNATTRVDPDVLQAMLPYLTEHYGNPSSMHRLGALAAKALRSARQAVLGLLGASSEQEVVFTSGATESNHSAVLSSLEAEAGRDELVISAVEHPSLLITCRHLEQSRGVKVHVVPVDGQGRLDLDAYQRALSPRTALASVMWANNETGTLYDVARLAELAHLAGALFHTDAVQATGRVPMDLNSTAIDFLSLSAHKLHGPKGVGALYVKKGVRFRPALRGGHQERGRRAGTENVPGIVGLGRAAELARAAITEEDSRVRRLRDRLERGILERVPRARVNGAVDERLANTSNISFERVDGEALLDGLDRLGIAVASGAACASGMNEPSHVLRAMRVPPALAMGSVRFSLSKDNSDHEVDRVLEVLPPLVESLRLPRPMGPSSEASSSHFGSQPA